MKKRYIALTLLLALALTACGGITSYTAVLKANWGVSLPKCTELYSANTGPSFHGDGIRYHVFSVAKGDVDTLFTWREADESTADSAAQWLNELDVPHEHRPDFDSCKLYRQEKSDNSQLLVFLDSEKAILYVVEQLI